MLRGVAYFQTKNYTAAKADLERLKTILNMVLRQQIYLRTFLNNKLAFKDGLINIPVLLL